ncbi:MAG TPA: biphenyl 2,3-dioxygenase, partial [Planctomycetaceae bacterium]|nr:biphenyl 2,3-dioxygenase [Planctomycetaceae bacterium]
MADYVKVLNVAELDDPGKTILEVDDRIVVLVHVNGLFYCIDD